MNDFAGKVLKWYHLNKRELPWRTDKSPYSVWLSEIILQQTRVSQGLPYYLRFMEAFPDLPSMARASEHKILKLWQGLGYYSRARNMLLTAKTIVKEYKGEFPSSYEELRKLPGVGPYTAAAIASVCFSGPHAAVDGNVYRVLSRYFGVDAYINKSAGQKLFNELASSLLYIKDPGNYNQAVIELGATQCVPKNPDCGVCVLQTTCVALREGIVHKLPRKEGKTKTRLRYFNYFMITQGPYVLLNKRGKKDIWEGMFDFPLVESKQEISPRHLEKNNAVRSLLGKEVKHLHPFTTDFKHILSHQVIHARFFPVEIKSKVLFRKLGAKYTPVRISAVHKYPIPRLIDRFLETVIRD